MEEPREYSSPMERAIQRARDAEAAKQRTAILVSMIHYDNLPPIARDIAKEFTMPDINKVRKHLELMPPLTDQDWNRVRQFLLDVRARKQEQVLSGEIPYYVDAKKALDKSPVFR